MANVLGVVPYRYRLDYVPSQFARPGEHLHIFHGAVPVQCELSDEGAFDALCKCVVWIRDGGAVTQRDSARIHRDPGSVRSEEHTSELQSLRHLVCRLLLE